jgi:hypothetical protein
MFSYQVTTMPVSSQVYVIKSHTHIKRYLKCALYMKSASPGGLEGCRKIDAALFS